MNGQMEKSNHEIFVRMRKELTVSGVREVKKFDENEVSLLTTQGEVCVEGSNMKIEILDVEKGIVTARGRIDAILYSVEEKGEKRGLFARLFR